MKRMLLVGMLLIAGVISSFSQGLGFNYQAMIRNAEGEAILNQEVVMRIGIVQGSVGGTVLYTETHSIESNAYGLVNLVVGMGEPVTGVFADIDWSAGPFFLKVELDAESNNNFVTLGTTQLLSVPFANYAFSGGSGSTSWADAEESVSTNKKVGIGTASPSSYLEVIANEPTKEGEPIFEVKKATGETVFAVYDNEVVVYVDDTTTAASGFAVKSRSNLGNTSDIFTVSPQQTRIFVEESTVKGLKGGFAITGNSNKGLVDILNITPTLTEFFVDEPVNKEKGGFAITGNSNKGLVDVLNITPSLTQFMIDESINKEKGGFAISGRGNVKELGDDLFQVTTELTQVFVNETTTKETKGGFAVTGKDNLKKSDDGYYSIFTVQPERTEIYVKDNPLKEGIPGFSIYGLDDEFGAGELFSVSEAGTFVNTTLAVAPKVTTGGIVGITQTQAFGGGSVTDSSGSEIIEVGIIYNNTGALSLEIPFNDPSVSGIVMGDPAQAESFSGLLMQGLEPGVTYQVRAYAINADGATGYGAISTFTTLFPYNVSFNVMNSESIPINNATITVNQDFFPYNSTTNAEGDYNFGLAGGNYWFNISAQGFYDYGASVFIIGDSIVDVYMTEAPAQLTMNVTDDLGNPVEYAYIDFTDQMEGYEWAETDTLGVAKVYLTPGLWNYIIYETPTTLEYTGSVTMEDGVDQEIDVTVTSLPTYTVVVSVTDPDMLPVEGAYVYGFLAFKGKDSQIGEFEGYTGADGTITFTNVPEGQYDISVDYDGMFGFANPYVNQDVTVPITLTMAKENK